MTRRPPVFVFETAAELLRRLGGISPHRVRLQPPPGTATVRDLIRLNDRKDKLYELVDGTLVEKVMGFGEGGLAADLIRLLGKFLDQNDLGDLVGADAGMRLMPGLVRIPDVSFLRWERYPNPQRPTDPVPDLSPDLAVEVLSQGNTRGEMVRKLREYFQAGVSLVWLVGPKKRTVQAFTAPGQSTLFTKEQTLDGGAV